MAPAVPESPEMMFELGKQFYISSSGASDPTMAMHFFLKAAEAGCIPAQRVLGSCYLEGRYASPDYGEAHKWLSLAARQNDGLAAFSLARMYVNGLGVNKDWGLAYKLLNMGCACSLIDSRALKQQMKEAMFKKFPNIIRSLAKIETNRRCRYNAHRQRFIQFWDISKNIRLEQAEFDIWLKLEINDIAEEQGLAQLMGLVNTHYDEQECLYPL